jgi:rubrerythrin
MKVLPFIDEDWTGLTHQQIYSQIRSELEEQQCKEDGHKWYPVFICRTCGESFELEECSKVTKKKIKREIDNVFQQQQ